MRGKLLRWIVAGLAALVVLISTAYLWDMHLAYRRIRSHSTVISSPYGDIEFSAGGSGPPVLAVHGSGGGYDQGELLARAVLDDRFHWIAPSRFGYLRSTFHEGATFDDQAHAYAHLLDHLGIRRAAVVALSHGGPSALLFALLHPERVSSLTLISCGVASSSEQDQDQANQKGNMLVTVYSHDPLYWGITKLFRRQFLVLMGADHTVTARMGPEQRELVRRIIDDMNPVAPRSDGVVFDNRATMPNERIAAIRAPTLVLHAKDDTLQLYHNAQFAAATIPGAELVSFDRGGHLLLAAEQQAVSTATQEQIRRNAEQLR